jgi:lysophospholipase L1-like esterase
MKSFISRAFFCVMLGAAATLAACSDHHDVPAAPAPSASPVASPTSPGTPSPSATPTTAAAVTNYTAIGASDAVGYGASVPCANPPTVAVPTCPGGTGYVPDLANLLVKAGATVTLNDLGISGAVIGPDILATVNAYGALGTSDACQPRGAGDAYPADFITAELPKVTGNETLVTIFAGGNDTNGIANAAACMSAANPPATAAQIQTFVTNEITAFGNDLESLVVQVHTKAPKAKIVIANLPNFSLIPVGQAQSAAGQQLLASISVGIDLNVIDLAATSFGFPVVDLLCNPQSYVPANFYTDGFHPNDAGYTAFAAAFDAQITAATPTAPSSTCSYASATSRVVGVPVTPFRDFSRPSH